MWAQNQGQWGSPQPAFNQPNQQQDMAYTQQLRQLALAELSRLVNNINYQAANPAVAELSKILTQNGYNNQAADSFVMVAAQIAKYQSKMTGITNESAIYNACALLHAGKVAEILSTRMQWVIQQMNPQEAIYYQGKSNELKQLLHHVQQDLNQQMQYYNNQQNQNGWGNNQTNSFGLPMTSPAFNPPNNGLGSSFNSYMQQGATPSIHQSGQTTFVSDGGAVKKEMDTNDVLGGWITPEMYGEQLRREEAERNRQAAMQQQSQPAQNRPQQPRRAPDPEPVINPAAPLTWDFNDPNPGFAKPPVWSSQPQDNTTIEPDEASYLRQALNQSKQLHQAAAARMTSSYQDEGMSMDEILDLAQPRHIHAGQANGINPNELANYHNAPDPHIQAVYGDDYDVWDTQEELPDEVDYHVGMVQPPVKQDFAALNEREQSQIIRKQDRKACPVYMIDRQRLVCLKENGGKITVEPIVLDYQAHETHLLVNPASRIDGLLAPDAAYGDNVLQRTKVNDLDYYRKKIEDLQAQEESLDTLLMESSICYIDGYLPANHPDEYHGPAVLALTNRCSVDIDVTLTDSVVNYTRFLSSAFNLSQESSAVIYNALKKDNSEEIVDSIRTFHEVTGIPYREENRLHSAATKLFNHYLRTHVDKEVAVDSLYRDYHELKQVIIEDNLVDDVEGLLTEIYKLVVRDVYYVHTFEDLDGKVDPAVFGVMEDTSEGVNADIDNITLLPCNYVDIPIGFVGDYGVVTKQNSPELYEFMTTVTDLNKNVCRFKLVTDDNVVINFFKSVGTAEPVFYIHR